jgi:nucleotide-binding universal stress UspA family protein
MKTLLVAIDLSDASQPILHTAVSLARQLGARLDVIHVVEPILTTVPIGAAMDVIEVAPPIQGPLDLQNQSEHLTRRVASIANGVEFSAEAISGMASDEILERAATVGADFIILGSHGRGAIYHLFAGSVVTGVLKHSKIPVVVVPIGKQ